MLSAVHPTENLESTISGNLDEMNEILIMLIYHTAGGVLQERSSMLTFPSFIKTSNSCVFPDITQGSSRFYCNISRVSATKIKWTSLSTDLVNSASTKFTLYYR